MNPKLSLAINIAVLVISVVVAHRSRSSAAIYASYVLAGAVSFLLLAGAYHLTRSESREGGLLRRVLCRPAPDKGLLKALNYRYPDEEARFAAKNSESGLDIWWAAFRLAVFPLVFTALYSFIAVRTGTAAGEVFSRDALLWGAGFYLLYALLQGQFLVDPRFNYIDQVHLNGTDSLLVATSAGGLLGLFFGIFAGIFLPRYNISIGTLMLAFCLLFDLVLLKNGVTEKKILGQRYSARSSGQVR